MTESTTESKARENANRWIDNNPTMYGLFVRLALDRVKRGIAFGINQLREVVRWEYEGRKTGVPFKFCNTHSPYVARRMLEQHPEIGNFMRCRATKDEVSA